jgi:two-component system, response regulator PdtaR
MSKARKRRRVGAESSLYAEPTMNARPLKIIVADDEAEIRDFLREVLQGQRHDVVCVETGRQLVEQCQQAPPDLVVTDIKMPDMDGLEAARLINRDRPTPIVLISGVPRPELLNGSDTIMAYLIKPLKPDDIQIAVTIAMSRFAQYESVRREASELRQALEDRKLVERAKGIIMRRLRIEEPEAFLRLKRLASNQNRKLVEVSQAVIDSEEIFQHLETCELSKPRRH